MVQTILVGGRHVSLNESLLVTTSTSTRAYAQIVLDSAVLEVIATNTANAKKAENVTISPIENGETLELSHVRAVLFSRIVHAMQGRSGLRPTLIQFLVDLLNADIQSFSLPTDETQIGDVFIGLFNGSNIPSSLADEITKKSISTPYQNGYTLSIDEVTTLRQSSMTRSLVGIGSNILGRCYSAIGTVDAVSALTCASVGVPNELKDDSGSEFRPHRSIITSHGNLKCLLRESSESNSNNIDLINIPQIHGPAIESITTSLKALATEFNSFEKSTQGVSPLGIGPILTILRNCLIAIISLEEASRKRLSLTRKGIRPWSPPSINTFVLSNWELLSKCQEAINSLENSLIAETDSAIASIEKVFQEAKQAATTTSNGSSGEISAEVKTRMDAIAEQERLKKEKMSPEELAKYEKKKAEKEAKAAAKAASKKNKDGKSGGSSGSAGGKSGIKLSPGVEAIINMFKTNNSSIQEKLNFIDGSFSEEVSSLLEVISSGGKNRTPKIAKGTRDFGPAQMKVRSNAFEKIRNVFNKHGAVEIDTPVFELKDTLTGKYGEDSKLIYDLADQGGELLALRYDLTVPFARFLAMHSVGNIKRFHIAKVYRRDNPQLARGRYREFYQCDFDIAGTYLPMVADAEVVTLACEILASLEIGSFVVKLNHRVILDAIFEICGVPADKFRAICSAVDKLDKSPWSEVRREMTEEKGLSEESADKIGTFVKYSGSPREMHAKLIQDNMFGKHVGANKALEDLSKLWDYLEAMGSIKYVSFDLSLARGLDYYTGLIYECVHTEEGGPGVGSIAAGGRYDNLVGMFSESNSQVPCVGVSIGVERIFAILEAKQKSMNASSVTCFVASVGKGMLVERMKAARYLWEGGVSAEFWQNKENPRFAGPGSQLDYVLKSEIPFVAIVGEEEAKQGLVKLKQLSYDGDGEEDEGIPIPLTDLASYIKNCLKTDNDEQIITSNILPIKNNSSKITSSIQKSVCCVPGVKLTSTSKFSVLDLSCTKSSQPKKPETAPKKATPAPAAEEDEDDLDLGFDDEEEEEEKPTGNSRAEQAKALKEQRDKELEEKKAAALARLAKKEANQRSLCNLEIKPWEAEQDLMALFEKIKKTVVIDGLKWSENCALVDVAFGIKKIVLTAVISLNLSMDAIIEDMTEEIFVDEIQSMTMTSMSLL